jgi:hypothetical protein
MDNFILIWSLIVQMWPYVQILLISAGVIYCVSRFSSNHANRSNGTGHYSWIHPRFLALSVTIVSCSLLLLWPIGLACQKHPVVGTLMLACVAGALVLSFKKFEMLKVLFVAPFGIPFAGLLLGGMPAELCWPASITILNLVPTIYLLHHNDEGLFKLLHRGDIRVALFAWFAGHVGAYWSLVTVILQASWSLAPGVFWNAKPIAITLMSIVIGLGGRLLLRRRAAFMRNQVTTHGRVANKERAESTHTSLSQEHGPHMLELS